MNDNENYKRPLADHETPRSNILTAVLVIALAITLPVLLVPEKEEDPVVEVIETANVAPLENPAQAAPPPDSLDPFGDYAAKDNPWSVAGLLEAIKHFILNYTVFGFIYQNVDEQKVKNSFSDLKEKAKPIKQRQER